MNEITFVFRPRTDLWTWREGVTETIDIVIDGRNLIDMVRDIELPYATAESNPDLAGAYIGLLANDSYAPSETLLGKQDACMSYDGKNTVLICRDCGEPGCWPLMVSITMSDNTVTWSDFVQPHRLASQSPDNPWYYDNLGPFVFERQQYEKAAAMCDAKYRHAA